MGSREWNAAAEAIEAQKRQPEIEAKEIEEEARKLEDFLNSADGEAAKRLLRAMTKHVLLGQLPASPGHTVSCFLDGEGLKKVVEGSAYEKKQDFSSSTPEQAVKAFTRPIYGMRKPSEIISFIHGELDKIIEGIKQG